MKRKASSPIVAQILLVFITVIVAVPGGGYIFGTMGNFTRTAQVSVPFATCSPVDANTTDCTLNLNNLGSANAELKPSSYLLIFYGHSTAAAYSRTCPGQGGDVIRAGSSLMVDCIFK